VATISSGLASKLVTTIFSGLASKPVTMVSPSLTSKSVVGFLVEHQNQGGGQFLDLGLKTDNYDLVILVQNHRDGFLVWASKPSML
jgi:hypothetical protein